MTKILQSIFSTDIYGSQSEKLKATFIYSILSIIVTLLIVISTITLNDGGIANPAIPLVASAVLVVVYLLVRNRQLTIASWMLVLTFVSVIIVNNVIDGSIGALSLLINIFLIVMAGFLLETRGIVLTTITGVVQLFAIGTIEGVTNSAFTSRIPLAFIYIATGLLIYAYNQFVRASRQEGEDVEGVERLKLADITMQITRQASTRVPFQTALNETLDLILENYPEIYHAQVFLIDADGVQARLTASTGEVGQQLIANQHALAVGSMSVIGQTTLRGETIIARAGEKDSTHRTNELLPDTQLEVAFPLQVGTEIIGALDLQSKVLDTLSANDRLTFQSLANSLSLTIDSIRQFEQSQARIEENQRLTEQTRAALHEVERLNQRLIGRAWTDYTRGVGDELGLMTDFEADTSETYLEWSEALVNAVNSNGLVQNGNIMAVPLRVRGQVVGAVEFELDEHNEITSEDLDLVREVSERFGLAAENTRLLEESLRTAQREALINQVTSSFQASQNVEATLAEAARSISESLEAGKVMIRLGMPDASHNGKDS